MYLTLNPSPTRIPNPDRLGMLSERSCKEDDVSTTNQCVEAEPSRVGHTTVHVRSEGVQCICTFEVFKKLIL